MALAMQAYRKAPQATRLDPTISVPSLDFSALFDHSPDGLAVIDPSLHIVAANRALSELLHLPPEELAGRHLHQVVHSTDVSAQPLRLALLSAGAAARTRRRLSGAPGVTVEAEITASRLPGGNFLCAVRPVAPSGDTGLLRDSQERFRTVAENLNAGLVITDLQDRAIYVNEHFCRLTGYSAQELIGQKLARVLLPPHEAARAADRLRARAAGEREVYEVEHRRKDGTSFMAEISASPLHDGEGRPIGTIAVVIDVTARQEGEREMARREQHYRTLFEVTPLPVCVYDTETLRILAVNPAATEQYGYSQSEFLSMTILDVQRPEFRSDVREMVASWQDGGPEQLTPRLSHHVKKDGTPIDVEVTGHPLEYEGRRARLVVVHDVTEHLRIGAKERELAMHMLQAGKMEAVGRLAGGVAHDFNNLLSVTLTAAAALDDMLPADSPLREEVRDIRDAAERGAALTRQLLAFGRKDTHAPVLLDVNDVLANVERLLARALGGDITLVVRRSDRPLHTIADAGQLEQVLMNLAINARDAMPDGGTVVLATDERELSAADAETLGVAAGRYVTIRVTDDGIGMDEETRSRAFEPFFTTKGPERGTGLGLAAVYGIVRETSGAVTIDSAPGRGTTVTISLPQHPGRREQASASPDGVSRRILLVEDEPRVRVQARRLLERCGYTVFDAADGADAERQFDVRGGGVDVVVTDIVMPGLGGVELVSRLRERDPGVAVVFVSGYAAENRQLPLNDRTLFVPKPYSAASLCEAIETAAAG